MSDNKDILKENQETAPETEEVKTEAAEPAAPEAKDEKEQILDSFLAGAEEEAAKKKSNKGVIIALLVIVLAVAAGLGYKFIYVPQQQYNAAMELFNEGYYEEAADAFIAMEGYKDSDDKAMECYDCMAYDIADQLFELGDLETALTTFRGLGDFKDSADRAAEIEGIIKAQEAEKEAIYDEGCNALDSGDPEAAIRKFKKLDEDYEDAASMLLKAKHQSIVQNFGSPEASKYLAETLQTYDPVMTADEIKLLLAETSLYLRDPDLYIHDYYNSRSMIGTEIRFVPGEENQIAIGYTIEAEGEAQNISWGMGESDELKVVFDNKKAMVTGHESPDTLAGSVYELTDGAYLLLVDPKISDGKASCERAIILIKKNSKCAKRIESTF